MIVDPSYLVMCLGAAAAQIPQSLQLTLVTLLICVIIGTLVALARAYEVPGLNTVLSLVTAVLKSLPTNLIMLVVYLMVTNNFVAIVSAFGLDLTIKDLNLNVVSIAALTLCGLPDVSEDIRAGLLSVGRGQYEAGYAVGLTGPQTFFSIVLPQAVRSAIPPLTGTILTLFKTTALVSVIGNVDIMSGAVQAANTSYCYLEAYIAAALVFWALGFVLERLSRAAERYFGRGLRPVGA